MLQMSQVSHAPLAILDYNKTASDWLMEVRGIRKFVENWRPGRRKETPEKAIAAFNRFVQFVIAGIGIERNTPLQKDVQNVQPDVCTSNHLIARSIFRGLPGCGTSPTFIQTRLRIYCQNLNRISHNLQIPADKLRELLQFFQKFEVIASQEGEMILAS